MPHRIASAINSWKERRLGKVFPLLPSTIGILTALFFGWITVFSPEVFWSGALYEIDPLVARAYGFAFFQWAITVNVINHRRTYLNRTMPVIIHMSLVIANAITELITNGNPSNIGISFLYLAVIFSFYQLEVVDGDNVGS